MSAFEILTVLFSVFVGLAISHLLFLKPIFSPFTIMPFLLIFLLIHAAITESQKYHGFVCVFTFVSLIIFMSLDVTIIQ